MDKLAQINEKVELPSLTKKSSATHQPIKSSLEMPLSPVVRDFLMKNWKTKREEVNPEKFNNTIS